MFLIFKASDFLTSFQKQIINLILSSLTFVLGFLVVIKTNNKIIFYISVSFLLFFISHSLYLLGFNLLLINVTRILAYSYTLLAINAILTIKIPLILHKNAINVSTQIASIIISIFILIGLLYYSHSLFSSADPKPNILPILPTTAEKKITEIKAGLFINGFPTFNTIKNEFIMKGILWFEFDPHLITLDHIEKFSFDRGTILEKSKPKTKILNDSLFTEYKIKVQFESNMDFHLFPLEDHQIHIVLMNTFLDSRETVITSYDTNLLMNKDIFTSDWKNINKNVEFGYGISNLDEHDPQMSSFYPIVLFTLNFQKSGMKKGLLLFLPLFLAFFLAIYSLMIKIEHSDAIISFSIGSVSALIADLFVIQKMSPDVSYFTIIDSVYSLLLVCVFFILLINIYIIKKVNQKNIVRFNLIRSYLFLFLIIFILYATHYYMHRNFMDFVTFF